MSTEQPQLDEETQKLALKMPFLFPGAIKSEEEEAAEPPFHPELEEMAFMDLYALIFDKMQPGERIIDSMKRINKVEGAIDEMAKWISELFLRGEIEIIETDWILCGLNAGKIDSLQKIKWELLKGDKVTGPFSAEEIAPKEKVLDAKEAKVRPVGTEEWIPVKNIQFHILVL